MKAINHFSIPEFSRHTASKQAPEMCCFHYCENGMETFLSVERTFQVAKAVLEDEELYRLKFKALTDGLKLHGMELLYEIIMGEKLV